MKGLTAALVLATVLFAAGISIGKEDVVIKDGKKVAFSYTLTVDGKVVDSSEGREPAQYTHGKGEIIPGLSKQLEGMRVGDQKTIVVPPEEGYGMANPTRLREIARSSLPADIDPKVGMLLEMRTPDGKAFPVRISELKKDTVVIDYNHPLAGKALQFQVKILTIQ